VNKLKEIREFARREPLLYFTALHVASRKMSIVNSDSRLLVFTALVEKVRPLAEKTDRLEK
jgi:hypothetical protein